MYIISTDPTAVPTRDDGTLFPYALTSTTTAATIFADTVTELVEQVISGYNDLVEPTRRTDEHFDARLASLSTFGAETQAELLAAASDDEFAALSDEELTALLSPKDGISLELPTWSSTVPLVLLTTNYEPFTDTPPPASDSVLALDPTTELTYIQSLERLGRVELTSIG